MRGVADFVLSFSSQVQCVAGRLPPRGEGGEGVTRVRLAGRWRPREKACARSTRSPRRLRDPGTPSRGKQLADMHPQLAPCSRRRPMDCAMTRLPLTLAGAKRDPRWGDRAASGRSRRRRAGADRAEAAEPPQRVLLHEKSSKASCSCSRSTGHPKQVRSPLEPAASCRSERRPHTREPGRAACAPASPHAHRSIPPHLTDPSSAVRR